MLLQSSNATFWSVCLATNSSLCGRIESGGESSTILDLALLRREIDNLLGIVPGVPYGPVPALVVAATATQYPRLGFSPTIMREVAEVVLGIAVQELASEAEQSSL